MTTEAIALICGVILIGVSVLGLTKGGTDKAYFEIRNLTSWGRGIAAALGFFLVLPYLLGAWGLGFQRLFKNELLVDHGTYTYALNQVSDDYQGTESVRGTNDNPDYLGSIKRRIAFDKNRKFKASPHVILSVVDVEQSDSKALRRYAVDVARPDVEGFDLVLHQWNKPRLVTARVEWTAIGEGK